MRWALACIVLLTGCHRTTVPPRTMHLQIAVGPDLRRQPDWRDRIASRIRSASEMFSPLNLQLEVATVSEWEPDPNQPLERNRWRLAGFHSSGDWIELGFYGSVQPAVEPGLAVPFDPRVIVCDIAGAPEERQAAAVAHEIGHVFGAWHPQEGGSVMSLPPAAKFDSTATAVLQASRTVDLRQGASSLNAEAVKSIQKIWTDAKAEPSTNPFYRFYANNGGELFLRGNRAEAVENFKNALKYAPDAVRGHIDLGNSLLATRDYLEAADEFQKAAKLDPHAAAAQSGLAAALIGSGHREEGMQALTTNIRNNPGDPAAHANLGVVLVGMPGHLDEGIAELREALRINPNFDSAKRSLNAALEAKNQGRK
jgi:hypothetical protein